MGNIYLVFICLITISLMLFLFKKKVAIASLSILIAFTSILVVMPQHIVNAQSNVLTKKVKFVKGYRRRYCSTSLQRKEINF